MDLRSTDAPAGPQACPYHEPASESTPTKVGADEFKQVFRHHPAGVAVVTADDGTGPVSMTVSSVFSINADPPLLGFSASHHSSSTNTIRNAKTIVVHMTAADEIALAKLGAASGVDRFAGTNWARLSTGEPYYTDATTWMRCRIINCLDLGSSYVFVVQALEAQTPPATTGKPGRSALVYHDRAWHQLDANSRLD